MPHPIPNHPESLSKVVDMIGDPRIVTLPLYGGDGPEQILGVKLPDGVFECTDQHILEITNSLRVLSEALVRRYGSAQLNSELDKMLHRQEQH